MSEERGKGGVGAGNIDFDKAWVEDYQRKRAEAKIIKEAERKEGTRNAVAAFGGDEDLGRAFFNYTSMTNADYRSEGIGGRNKVAEGRDVFVQALADKLMTGKREDTVLALTALLAAVDNRARAVLNSIPYRGPYGG